MTSVPWKDQTKLVARPIKSVTPIKFFDVCRFIPLIVVICRLVEWAL